jgi:hypothetical protein
MCISYLSVISVIMFDSHVRLYFFGPVLSCLVLSCLVLSCRVLFCLVLSCLVCLVFCNTRQDKRTRRQGQNKTKQVLSCLVLPCLVLSCLVLSGLVLSCQDNKTRHKQDNRDHSVLSCSFSLSLSLSLLRFLNFWNAMWMSSLVELLRASPLLQRNLIRGFPGRFACTTRLGAEAIRVHSSYETGPDHYDTSTQDKTRPQDKLD